MNTSAEINELATALAKAQGEIDSAKKDSTNPFFQSKYADLAAVRDAIRVPFFNHGLSVAQFPQTRYEGVPESYEWQAKRSGETRYGVKVFCVVGVVTRLMHTSGQWLEDEVSAMLPNGDPQAVGSAITYLRRYALQAVAGVAAEDDDAEATTTGKGAPAALPAGAPAGYDAWLIAFAATAKDGIEALRAAYKAAPLEYREYLALTDRDRMARMSEAAKAITDKATAAAMPLPGQSGMFAPEPIEGLKF
jgi:hypothetical protein